ncbi:hypothetical protein MY4824_009417 [Beauveria thailandica]
MKLITALHPAAVMALSIGGPWSSLEAREGEGPSISQTFKSLAGLGLVNGTGCVIDDDGASKKARAETERSCTNQQQQVDTGLAQCVQRAKRAEKAARDGSELFQQYFKTQDTNTREEVAQFFATIASGCDKNGNQPVNVECTPTKRCTLPQTGDMELAAIATWNQPGSGSTIQLCRTAFTMHGDGGGNQRRQDQGQCEENLSKLGDLLVHEMSHATVSTRDVIYGKEGCLGLSTNEALQNADSLALFSQDVSAGCAAEPGAGGQPPNNGNNPPNNGNNPPINDDNPPINDDNPPINENNPPINETNPPINGSNPPISGGDEMPPNDGNYPPINDGNEMPPNDGNYPPISDGNEWPPYDQVGGDGIDQIGGNGIDQIGGNGIDQIGGNGIDQIGGNGIDQIGGNGIDQIGGNGIDQIGGNGIDQIGGNGIDQIGGNGIDQFDNNEDYLNNQGGPDGFFGGDASFWQ